jgi:hypothetical protein
MSMRRVLIFGYSVTEDKAGFAALTRELARASPLDEIEVEICGVGGLNPLPMAALYERVVKYAGPFDYVFLEFSTTIFGARITDWVREGLDPLYDLFERIMASGARLALINLYRDDFSYPYHVYDMVLESLSARHGIPLLDLGAGLFRHEGQIYCRSLLRDNVHTNQEGAVFQANRVWSFIRSVIRDDRPHNNLPAPQWHRRALDLATACPTLQSSQFSRAGLKLTCGVLKAEESCLVTIPEDVQLYGISFLSGPLSGEFTLDFHGVNKRIAIAAYDERCYYLRYNFRRFGLIAGCTAVTITQGASLPDIRLVKGEANLSARVGNPIALHYFEKRKPELASYGVRYGCHELRHSQC